MQCSFPMTKEACVQEPKRISWIQVSNQMQKSMQTLLSFNYSVRLKLSCKSQHCLKDVLVSCMFTDKLNLGSPVYSIMS